MNCCGGKTGILFLSEGPMVITDDDHANLTADHPEVRPRKRKVDKFLDEVNDFAVSFDGEKILYRKGDHGPRHGRR